MGGRRFSAALSLIGALLVARTASAQMVVHDPALMVEAVDSRLKQVEQLKSQLESYELQVRDHLAPTAWLVDETQRTIDRVVRLRDFINIAQMTSSDVDAYLSRFKNVDYYRSSPCFRGGGCSEEEIRFLTQGQESTLDSRKRINDAIFKLLGRQFEDMEDEADRVRHIDLKARSAKGQLEAVGYANQLAHAQAEQLLQIRLILAAQNNIYQGQVKSDLDRQIQERVAADFLRGGELAKDASGFADRIVEEFRALASKWVPRMTRAASSLFWSLVIASLIIMCARPSGDVFKLFAELLMFCFTFGFHWWCLTHASELLKAIMDSMTLLGAEASGLAVSGLGAKISPSVLIEKGFVVIVLALKKSTLFSPVDSLFVVALSCAIAYCFFVIAFNLLDTLIGGWLLGYAGIFFLGFGGSKWTSDIAINYYRAVLSAGAQLLGMILLAGFGFSVLNSCFERMTNNFQYVEMIQVLVVAFFWARFTNKLPASLASLTGGIGSKGDMGGGGAGILGAATMTAAGAMLGAGGIKGSLGAMATSAAAIGGGVSAVMAAAGKASEHVAAGTDILSNLTGGGGSGASSSSQGASQDAQGGTPFSEAAGLSQQPNDPPVSAVGSGDSNVGGGQAKGAEPSGPSAPDGPVAVSDVQPEAATTGTEPARGPSGLGVNTGFESESTASSDAAKTSAGVGYPTLSTEGVPTELLDGPTAQGVSSGLNSEAGQTVDGSRAGAQMGLQPAMGDGVHGSAASAGVEAGHGSYTNESPALAGARSGNYRAGPSAAQRALRIAADTTYQLGKTSFGMARGAAKEGVSAVKAAAHARVGQSTGGRIAAAIHGQTANLTSDAAGAVRSKADLAGEVERFVAAEIQSNP